MPSNTKPTQAVPKVVRIHHVQITIPTGQEAAARDFYCKVMGLAA